MFLETPIARFELKFDAEGRNNGGYRNDITVYRRARVVESFDLPTDEGTIIGGTGTAPYPLAYFASGLTGCLMTHLRSFAKRLNMPTTDFAVTTRCHWAAQQAEQVLYESKPLSFTMDIEIGGDVSDDEKRRLIAASSRACFVEQSMKPGLVKHRLKSGEAWIDLDE